MFTDRAKTTALAIRAAVDCTAVSNFIPSVRDGVPAGLNAVAFARETDA